MRKLILNALHKNLANLASILGILPLIVLFGENGFAFILPLIVFNNFMDDLDGILAKKLGIASDTGMRLDNVCDVFAHSVFVMVIGMQYGWICAAASLFASIGIVLRIVGRLDPKSTASNGSMTNELMRHTFFVLVLSQLFNFQPGPYLAAVFLMHTATMLAPFPMPFLLRKLTKSTTTILLLNLVLVVAWLVPITTAFIAPCFFFGYLLSLVKGRSLGSRRTDVVQVSMAKPADVKPK